MGHLPKNEMYFVDYSYLPYGTATAPFQFGSTLYMIQTSNAKGGPWNSELGTWGVDTRLTIVDDES